MGDISQRGRGAVRVRKQVGGPMSTARRDMTHGYYQPDMGMRGGQMFRGGGVVKKRGSMGVALKGGGRIENKQVDELIYWKNLVVLKLNLQMQIEERK